jgi:DNA-binding response OmpR family regulator
MPTADIAVSPSARVRRASRGLRHVLVVEDDPPIRDMLADVLQHAGYDVAQAVDGLEALHHLGERSPDLIILDLMLPGMSGWQFLERSRDQLDRANIPVVILSAIKGSGDYPASLGVAAWFNKPLDLNQFLTAVEKLAGAPARSEHAPDATGSSDPPPHVLIVEDEETIRDLLLEYLEDQGYSADIATSIDEARQQIGRRRPDLILLDLMFPGEDGLEFLLQRRTNQTLAAVPVLAISAAAHAQLLEAKNLGADAFLSKPFDFDVLSALVRSFVGDPTS